MFLGEGKRANDHQSKQDKSGYDILHHGYHSGHPSVMFDSLHSDYRLRTDHRTCEESRPEIHAHTA